MKWTRHIIGNYRLHGRKLFQCKIKLFLFVCITTTLFSVFIWTFRRLRWVHRERYYNVTLPDGSLTAVGIYLYLQPTGDSISGNPREIWSFLGRGPSEFCTSISPAYFYILNVIYYQCDITLGQRRIIEELQQNFEQSVLLSCPLRLKRNVKIVFIPMEYPPDRVAWALGEVIWDQYVGGVEYFYIKRPEIPFNIQRIGTLTSTLRGKSPPNYGVLFPDAPGEFFFHATHIETFGWAYPRMFSQEASVRCWLHLVYQHDLGPTAEIIPAGMDQDIDCLPVKHRLEGDRNTVDRFKDYLLQKKTKVPFQDRRVISMSLYGTDKRYTNNAVRNALLVKLHFPSWTLRIYVEKPDEAGNTIYEQAPSHVLAKLVKLGVQLIYIDVKKNALAPMLWRFLVADDPEVDIFLVRDCDSLFSARDATVVEDWLKKGQSVHCVRDHPSHGNYALSGGLWGARRAELAKHLKISFAELMEGQYNSDYLQDMAFLGEIVWPQIQNHSYCHDSVTCDKWPSSHRFPIPRRGLEHLGAVFDAFGENRQGDMDLINETAINEYCVP